MHAFLPSTQLARIARLGERGDRAVVDHGWGAILTLDVSGFTEIAERHARDGARGIEALSEIVHGLFGTITEQVLHSGGDVLYHAGDAVCALFPAPTEADLDEACRRAVCAALQTHARLGVSATAAGVALRAAVGCGETLVWEVGGVDGEWILMIHGAAIRDNARVDRLAARGTVTVSEPVWKRLGPERQGSAVEGDAFRVTRIPPPETPAFSPPIEDASLSAVLASLPPVVRSRFRTSGLAPVAEFRPVSTFFASLPGFDPCDADVLARFQEAVVALQHELSRLGHPQLDVLGDKGLGFMGVFGLPPQAHDDDAVRATEAALAVRSVFASRGMKASVGVATGVVWAGPAGADGRYCYDVVGSVSILAARLMQAADDDVLTCAQTRRLAARSVDFVDLPPTLLKGFATPQPVSRPIGRRVARSLRTTRLAGRGTELDCVAARLDALREGRGGVVLLEAEPGMGKSVLLQAARELATTRGAVVFDGSADSIEVATPYHAVRGAVLDLLGVPRGSSPARTRDLVLSRLDADVPELAWLAPLLDAVVAIDLPDSPESVQIQSTTRAERLGDLIVGLLRSAVARVPVIWSVEDLHWADRASWSLCARLAEEVSGVLVLGTTRPMASPPPERERLMRAERCDLIVLDDLPASALGEIVSMRLGVAELPPSLLALLVARADGNPFFAEEIALAALESGGLVIENGEVRIERPLETLDLPTSITGVITSRMDRLTAPERNALRCAAVLGPTFDVRTLRALLPDVGASEVHALVERLAAATFFSPDPSVPAHGWRFRHAFLHETAYSLLTFAERRGLHAAAARAIEEAPEAELASVTALLAHHWEIAENPERAARYYGLAGKKALEADANRECVDHLTKALRFDESVRGPLTVDATRARWGRMITEASYSLGEHDAARFWGDKTFRWCGLRTPTHAGHVLVALAADVWRRYVAVERADEETCARYAEACETATTLQTVATWAGDRVGQLGLAVYADVVSRACGPSAARAIAQASMGFLLVALGMHEAGLRDATEAAETAETLGDANSRISTNVILGLALSSLGRNREALEPLAQARAVAERVGSGLWRHRALFQSGEPHYQLGELEVADELFDRCAEVARKVEPPVAGLSRAMQAACRLRRGENVDEALAILTSPDGLVVAEPGPTMMALVALGVHAWALLVAERYVDALASARKCVVLVTAERDDAIAFARAADGLAHAALVLTRLFELRCTGATGTTGLPPPDALERDAMRAAAGLARLARRWPAARPISDLVVAFQLRLGGKTSASARALERAAENARVMSQPWERALALRALARVHGRPTADLHELVRRHALRGVEMDRFPL